MWNPIVSAPLGRNIELAIIDENGLRSLISPCEKQLAGWRDPLTGALVEVHPTHWREWESEKATWRYGHGSLPKWFNWR